MPKCWVGTGQTAEKVSSRSVEEVLEKSGNIAISIGCLLPVLSGHLRWILIPTPEQKRNEALFAPVASLAAVVTKYVSINRYRESHTKFSRCVECKSRQDLELGFMRAHGSFYLLIESLLVNRPVNTYSQTARTAATTILLTVYSVIMVIL